MRRLLAILAVCLLETACTRNSPPDQQNRSTRVAAVSSAKSYEPNVPPTHKEILRALLRNQDVSLRVDSSCSGVGTEPTDTNIGDYLSGFLAEIDSEQAENWIEVSAKSEPSKANEPFWLCSVVIRHLKGDDRWGWGASFLMGAKDHSVVKSSFRCTGAG